MSVRSRARSLLAVLFHRRRVEEDMAEEWQFHVDSRVEALMSSGANRADAERQARTEFGDALRWREQGREVRGLAWLSDACGDVQYAVRQMRSKPGFAVFVIATLALGIGTNTAIFSVADAVLFRRLPYRDATRLVEVLSVPDSMPNISLSGLSTQEEFEGWRTQSQVFEGVEGHANFGPQSVEGEDDPLWVDALSHGALDLLGVSPTIGRPFSETEMVQGGDDVALISHGLWLRHFGGQPLSRLTLTIEGRTRRVIGVMPESFAFPLSDVQVWIPWIPAKRSTTGTLIPPTPIGRIRRGVSVEQAQQTADTLALEMQKVQPLEEGWRIRLRSFDERRATASTRRTLLLLLGSVGFVFLIACANVCALVLARTSARGRELAVRAALGASRGRLFRQLFVEGLVVAVIAGVAVIAASHWSIDALGRILPASFFGLSPVTVTADRRVVLFAGVVTLVAGMICGGLPALKVTRDALSGTLANTPGAGSTTARQNRWQKVLIAVEVGLTVVLLVGATLLGSSFMNMVRVDVGFNARNLAALRIAVPNAYRGRPAQDVFFDAVANRSRQLPGVLSVTMASTIPPLSGTFYTLERLGDSTETSKLRRVQITRVAPGFLTMLGVPVVEGRTIGADDTTLAPAAIVLDRATAESLWPHESAIGHQLRYVENGPPVTVVGVVQHVKGGSFMTPLDAYQAYIPLAQAVDSTPRRVLAVRTAADAEGQLPELRAIIRSQEHDARITEATTVEAAYDQILATPKFFASLMTIFALMGISLACIALYGLVSYIVLRRTRELGVRIALGASNVRLIADVIGQALAPTLLGVVIGMISSHWLAQLLRAQLFEVAADDKRVLWLAVIIMVVTALAATFVPARRATKVDPVVALRCE